jgi:hypothetical protein
MPSAPNDVLLSRLLPGTWRIGATNFPQWVSGDRSSPTFSYEIEKTSPLVLRETVAWTTADGSRKHLSATDRWEGNGFRRRGRGLSALLSSQWSVPGVSDDSSIAVIRFAKSLRSPAGVDVVVREGVESNSLRAAIAASPESFGLSHEEFASLTWFEILPA